MIELTVCVPADSVAKSCRTKTWYEHIVRLCKEEHIMIPSHTSIALVSEEEIRRINCETRHINRATDVLSFNYDSYAELILCPKIAQRQAKRFKSKSHCDELLRLVIHGLLHCAGYDHTTLAQQVVMRSRERSIIAKARLKKLCALPS